VPAQPTFWPKRDRSEAGRGGQVALTIAANAVGTAHQVERSDTPDAISDHDFDNLIRS
jgi:hypothetical protein